ncbi:hypothetical protein HQ544_00495 [Candidatus Falkowbacteria bacterium]|nr:hypothetical protein [Candidatus Falkowbacteria bacterium]
MSRLSRIVSKVAAEGILLGRRAYLEYKSAKTNSPFFKNRLVVWPLIINVALLILGFLYFFLKLVGREELIPLHYNIYFGVDLIGNKNNIFKLSFIGFLVFLINYFLAFLVYRREKLASYILIFVSLAVAAVLGLVGFLVLNI